MSVPTVERPVFPAVKRSYAVSEHTPKFARLFVQSQLGQWRLRHLADAIQMVADELVTNTVKHAGGATVDIGLEMTPTSVLIRVSDASPEPPVAREDDPLAENGRGLHIVQALSTQTGCIPDRRGGKTVWAEVMR